jgi:DNA polymerase-3 subunit epsilon
MVKRRGFPEIREINAQEKANNLLRGPYPLLPYNRVTVLDTETTGLYPFGIKEDGSPSGDPHGPDRLCSFTLQRLWRQHDGWKRVWDYTWMVDPRRPISKEVSAINGFTWLQGDKIPKGLINLASRDTFERDAVSVIDLLGDDPIVCHNTVFDFAVMDAELDRCGLPRLTNPAICTKKAYSDIQGLGRPNAYVRGTSLNSLCDYLDVDRSARKIHSSRTDAYLAASCFVLLDVRGWLEAEGPHTFPHYSY